MQTMQYHINVLILAACTLFVFCTRSGNVHGMELSKSRLQGDTRLRRSADQDSERLVVLGD